MGCLCLQSNIITNRRLFDHLITCNPLRKSDPAQEMWLSQIIHINNLAIFELYLSQGLVHVRLNKSIVPACP